MDLFGQSDELVLEEVIAAMRPTFVQVGIDNYWNSVRNVCSVAQAWHKRARRTPHAMIWKTNTPSKVELKKAASRELKRAASVTNATRKELKRAAAQTNATCRAAHRSECSLPGSHRFIDMHSLLLQLADPALFIPSRHLYVDALHFRPWVYHELNQVLLDALRQSVRR